MNSDAVEQDIEVYGHEEADCYKDDEAPTKKLWHVVTRTSKYVKQVLQDKTVSSSNKSPKDNHLKPKPHNFSKKISQHNPHSHFVALEHKKIVKDVESIRNKSIAIIGVGGIGGLVADILARCGVERLLLFDKGIVQTHHLGRMFYYPEHVGMSKLQAARIFLQQQNPMVEIKTFYVDLINDVDVKIVKEACLSSGEYKDGKLKSSGSIESVRPVDIILSCVDNIQARHVLNNLCLEIALPLFDVIVSPCSTRTYFRLVVPGITACLECIPTSESRTVDEIDNAISSFAPAILPSSELIAAGIMAQNVIKFLLTFGDVLPFFKYDTFECNFVTYVTKPNSSCPNNICNHYVQV